MKIKEMIFGWVLNGMKLREEDIMVQYKDIHISSHHQEEIQEVY